MNELIQATIDDVGTPVLEDARRARGDFEASDSMFVQWCDQLRAIGLDPGEEMVGYTGKGKRRTKRAIFIDQLINERSHYWRPDYWARFQLFEVQEVRQGTNHVKIKAAKLKAAKDYSTRHWVSYWIYNHNDHRVSEIPLFVLESLISTHELPLISLFPGHSQDSKKMGYKIPLQLLTWHAFEDLHWFNCHTENI